MYFKINKTGCSECTGLVEIRFDLYLDEADDRYEEHYVQVPEIPKEGYQGKLDEMNCPVDLEDYKKWLESLDKVWVVNPFCCHFVQMEPTATDEDIVAMGNKVLDMAYTNYRTDELHKNVNDPVVFSLNETKRAACVQRVQEIISTDFTSVIAAANTKKVVSEEEIVERN